MESQNIHKTNCSWLYFVVSYSLCFFLIIKSIYTQQSVLCDIHSISFKMYKRENKLHFDLLGFRQPLSLQCKISRLWATLQRRHEEGPRQRMRWENELKRWVSTQPAVESVVVISYVASLLSLALKNSASLQQNI